MSLQDGQLEEIKKEKLLSIAAFYAEAMCYSKEEIAANLNNIDVLFNGIIHHIIDGLKNEKLWNEHFILFARNEENRDVLYAPIDYNNPQTAYRTNYERPKLNYYGVQFFYIKVRPHCYSIRSETPAGKVRVNSLTSFCFQGYDEISKKWVTLDEQRNITTLTQNGSFYAFPVTTTRYYPRFRILQTDYSFARNMQFSISGFDIHGDIE